MSVVDWALGLVALVVGAGILYFIFTQPLTAHTQDVPASITLTGPPAGFTGQPLVYSIRVDGHAGEDVSISSEAGSYTFPCSTDSCIFPLTLTFSSVGESTIHAGVGNQYDELLVSIKSKEAVCVDGTLEGQCSSPPSRCVNHSLVADCDACGCPSGEVCTDHACTVPHLTFTLSLASLPSFYTTGVADIPFVLTNTSSFPASGLFVGRLSWYDSSKKKIGEKSQQYLLDNLVVNGDESLVIQAVFPLDAKYVSLEWFSNGSVYDATTLLAQTGELKPISVSEDKTPPSPPSGLSYHSISDGIELTWKASSSSDVVSYVVYQQSSANGGFTSYSIAGEVTSLMYDVTNLSGDTAFSITAKDGAGNESVPAQPVVVPGP